MSDAIVKRLYKKVELLVDIIIERINSRAQDTSMPLNVTYDKIFTSNSYKSTSSVELLEIDGKPVEKFVEEQTKLAGIEANQMVRMLASTRLKEKIKNSEVDGVRVVEGEIEPKFV